MQLVCVVLLLCFWALLCTCPVLVAWILLYFVLTVVKLDRCIISSQASWLDKTSPMACCYARSNISHCYVVFRRLLSNCVWLGAMTCFVINWMHLVAAAAAPAVLFYICITFLIKHNYSVCSIFYTVFQKKLSENCCNIHKNWYAQSACDIMKLQYYRTVVYITFTTTTLKL